MRSVSGIDAVEAWTNAVNLLLTHGEQTNLIVEIRSPAALQAQWINRFSPHHCKPAGDKITNVINTVFPWRLAQKCRTRTELYARYLSYHARSKRMRRHPGAWGAYFARLVEFGPQGPNQLETVIVKLGEWKSNFRAAFVFHPSGPHLDGPRTRGGPCWHYGQLLGKDDGTLDFLAVYRNHDYFNKALGNFIALGQLHKFICDQSGKRQGQMVCHSAHAYFDSTKTELQALVAR